jgi:hypothetical protein
VRIRKRSALTGEELCVDLDEVFPLIGNLVLGKAGVYWTGFNTGVAVDALVGVDVKHLNFVITRLVWGWVDAVDGTNLDA